MAEKKVKFSEFVSPVCIARWAFVNNPSKPYDGKGEPVYKIVGLLDDNDETRAWVDKVIAAGLAEAKAAGIKLKKQFGNPFQFPEDQDEDDFIPEEGKDKPKLDEAYRGRIYFQTKSQFKPGLIDTAKVELPEDVRIMNDDLVRIKVQVNPYDGFGGGISLRLKVVQLVEKKTSFSGDGQRGVNTNGFDEIEGYVATHHEPDDEDEEYGVEQF